ncbi:MAG TPA: hypothetical protein ENH60_10635 [Pricia sp.]|uniref:Uncharacterized protein n=1 Tax=Pricia antarctica TaxID=641691 RepID=A0A831QQZ9_9FLAO|nr:hypothetical protein [Pricia sp.]HEA21142.1 hypothetical protein [Pricia antarctica]
MNNNEQAYHIDRPFLVEWFKDFEPPEHFKGGCLKTRLKKYCYRIKPDGKLGKITENCEHRQACSGHRYDLEI